MSESYVRLHEEAVVIDGTCPLLRKPEYVEWFQEGGYTAVAPTVGLGGDAAAALRELGGWHRFINSRHDLLLVRAAADIQAAKQQKKLGIIFHFQGTSPIEGDLRYADAFKALGVGMVMLAYNQKNRVGDGCEERTDAGLSNFGVELVERLNELRIVIDCSHTGLRTTLDAIEMSSAPVVFSHSNPKAVHESRRNITDEQIKAVAKSGGLVGINGFLAYVSPDSKPTLDQFLRHVDYVVNLVGIDHVGLGVDYFTHQVGVATDAQALEYYEDSVRVGRWRRDTYPPPPYPYPEGIGTPKEIRNFTKALLERGYKPDDTKKILGGNWLRVFGDVLG
ncbi:MAG: rane dipeptidase [Variibacter sp.]|jgi:membrane dipeptidase|nr:rane dipeptidase [Variibacter sp.]